MMRMLKAYMPMLIAGALQSAITIAVLKTDVDWLKNTVTRHEQQITYLLMNSGGKAYAQSREAMP